MTALRSFINHLFTSNFGFTQVAANLFVSLIIILLWLILGIIILRVLRRLIKNYFKKRNEEKRSNTLSSLTLSTIKVFVWFIIILAIISELGFNITPILASAGILGLAIGFGAQTLVKDVISGFFIIMDDHYNIGETIEVNGFRGTIKAMNLRTTSIENFMGSILTLNNGSISQVINWSRRNNIALVDFGVDYDTDLDNIVNIMPDFLNHLQETITEIIEEPSFLGVTELADSSINMRIMAKTENGKHWATERKIRHELVQYLKQNNIDIPFPQLVLHNRVQS